MIVAWFSMAMGLTLANLDPLVDDSNSWGERVCVGWPFIYVSGFSTQAYSLSSGHFGAASLLANVVFAATFMTISAAVLRSCTWQRGSAAQFRLSDLFLVVTAAGILVFLVQWDRNLASLDFGLHCSSGGSTSRTSRAAENQHDVLPFARRLPLGRFKVLQPTLETVGLRRRQSALCANPRRQCRRQHQHNRRHRTTPADDSEVRRNHRAPRDTQST